MQVKMIVSKTLECRNPCLFHHVAFEVDKVIAKEYERRIFLSQQFEEVCAKYWALLKSQPDAKHISGAISKEQYTAVSANDQGSNLNF